MVFNNKSILIIGIGGGSGSGKTRLSKRILQSLGDNNINIISHDNYYKDLSHLNIEERNKINFDHPNSLDTELLINHLKEIKKKNTVQIPVYDFSTHTREFNKTIEIIPTSIIIVEGILIFTDNKLLELFDLKVYVDVNSDIRYIRRQERDITERARTRDQVIKQYMQTVRPMHNNFVEPSKVHADIIIPSEKSNDIALNLIVSAIDRNFV